MSNGHEPTERNPKGAGRPKIQLDTDQIVKLAELQCTNKEIAYVMGCSTDTLIRNYAEYIDKGKAGGRIKLRRAMMRNACENDNATMQIWLSKQWLGYSDNPGSEDEDIVLPWDTDK